MPNLTQIQNILPPIAQKHGVETVGLFGARACGDAQQTGIDPDTGLRA